MRFGLIGYGAVGSAIAKKLLETGKLSWVYTHSQQSFMKALNALLNSKVILKQLPDYLECEVLIISVPDKEILNVSKLLAHYYGSKLDNKIIFHTSGIVPATVLADLETQNAIIASAHPFQTFYKSKKDVFEDIFWGVECRGEQNSTFDEICKILGGEAMFLGWESSANIKKLYHSAAVFASNYIATSMRNALDLFCKIEGSNPKAIERIAHQAVKNAIDNKDEFTLTGPIARVDLANLEQIILDLKQHNIAEEEYKLMAKATALTAKKHGLIDRASYDKLLNIL